MKRTAFRAIRVSELSDTSYPDDIVFEKIKTLRYLPKKREVLLGSIAGKADRVVAKVFITGKRQSVSFEREWRNLIRLIALNVPCPTLLGIYQSEDSELAVITEELPDTTPVSRLLIEESSARVCELLQQIVSVLEDLHSKGARQLDQHIDNWLCSQGKIHVLDAASFRFETEPLALRSRLLDFVAVFLTLPPRAAAIFRDLALEALNSASGKRTSESLSAMFDKEAQKIQSKRTRRYAKKVQRDCSECRVISKGRIEGMAQRGLLNADLDKLIDRPEQALSSGECIKDGNTATVVKIELDDRQHVLKRYNRPSFFKSWKRSLKKSRARQTWIASHLLEMSFIKTAESLAFTDVGKWPRTRSYLLSELVEGQTLDAYIGRNREDATLVEKVASQVREIFDRLALMRSVHGDMKATNWIVATNGDLYLIDLDSFRFNLSKRSLSKGTRKDYLRFMKNWKDCPEVAEIFKRKIDRDGAS